MDTSTTGSLPVVEVHFEELSYIHESEDLDDAIVSTDRDVGHASLLAPRYGSDLHQS